MPAPVNELKKRLLAGEQTIGCWLTLADSYAAEIAGRAGFDWCLVDGEHAPNDLRSTLDQLQVLAGTETPAAVRPPIGEAYILKQLLDIGCQSFVIPMVEDRQQAEDIVRALRYPPEGIRGVGVATARASGFNSIPDYLQTANREICLIVQIESREGLANLDEIVAVDGVDGVFIGPSDLSASLGHLGNPKAPEVVAAIDDALDRIAAADKPSGIFSINPDDARRYLGRGVGFVAVASDINSLTNGLRDPAASLKPDHKA
jgi:4-hydroxy-2-oxoheptanedioate aldolase